MIKKASQLLVWHKTNVCAEYISSDTFGNYNKYE